MSRRRGTWKSASRSLSCVSCGIEVRNVGDKAVGVLCHRCSTSDEGWRAYQLWKAKQKPDALDKEIQELKQAIKELT